MMGQKTLLDGETLGDLENAHRTLQKAAQDRKSTLIGKGLELFDAATDLGARVLFHYKIGYRIRPLLSSRSDS